MRTLSRLFLTFVSLGLVAMICGVVAVSYVISLYSSDLPDYRQLEDYKPPVVTRIYAGDGRLMEEYAREKRVFVPIEEIPQRVIHAFLSAEDKNFYRHAGVDLFAIARAIVSNIQKLGTGQRPEGASTITQQVAKNFLLSSEVSMERKIKEAVLASRMERVLSKDRILELYLNEIYLGSRAYGIAAAALHYFNKSLDDLNLAESAYLASLPKAPNNYQVEKNYEGALERRNWVLDRMVEDDRITVSSAEIAKTKPSLVVKREEIETVKADYFAEEVRRELMNRYGEYNLYGGGLSVHTSIRPDLQDFAEKTLRNGLMEYDRRHGWRGPVKTLSSVETWRDSLSDFPRPEGMLAEWKIAVVLGLKPDKAEIGVAHTYHSSGSEFRTGAIALDTMEWARKALRKGYLGRKISKPSDVLSVGDIIMVEAVRSDNQDAGNLYELRQIPEVQGAIVAIDPHTGRILAMQGGWKFDKSEFNRVTQAWRQPGSAFKPFVYLPALENGFTPATLVLDAPFVMEQGPGLDKWRPSNYSKEYYGPTPIRVGIEKSRNLMTVRLAEFLGMPTIIDYARKFGITRDMEPLLANALGASETTLLRLTSAYAMLVNGGRKIDPTVIDRIQDRRGRTIFKHDRRPCEGCGNMIAWAGQSVPDIPDTREQIVDPRHAYQIVSMLEGVIERGTGQRIRELGKPLAGKTGTTDDSKDTWFIGFSPDLAVGVFVGFDKPRSLGRYETGSSVAAPVFKDFMAVALAGKPATPFRVPPGIRHVRINPDNGTRAGPATQNAIWEAFVAGSEPSEKTYILDGKGISLMPAVSGTVENSATSGTGGLY